MQWNLGCASIPLSAKKRLPVVMVAVGAVADAIESNKLLLKFIENC
jgi:hypothetical protein